MNISDARIALDNVFTSNSIKDYILLMKFLYEMETLMKNNSIKQTPALFKPFDKGG